MTNCVDPRPIPDPAECCDRQHSDDCRARVVWSWDGGTFYDDLTEEQIAAGCEFLRAHGINPMAWRTDNSMFVHVRCDGTWWLETWRAAGNVPLTEVERCDEHPPFCFKQERVFVPLVAPAPDLAGAGGDPGPPMSVAGGGS